MEAAIRGIAAALLVLAATPAVAADFDAGVEAYHRGDYASALREFRPLAVQGDAAAQSYLGFMYANGQGVPEDDRQAVYWYRLAAEQGNASAQNNLGVMYGTGQGVPEDDRQAVYWYRRAAEQGYAAAQANLGFMYDTGEGVPEDDRQAVYWYRLAAEQGHANAQANLGFMYANGEGVSEDDRQAVYWYRLAAEQGYANAQNNLGFMYANGQGVPEDDRQAVYWYRLAAEQGYAKAQFNLGLKYANGEGVPQDLIRAYAWANLAAAAGDETAKEQRLRTRRRMTPAQIAEAQALSRTLAARIESGRGMSAAREKEPLEPKSNGSGFMVGRYGEIVTNRHVVDGCARVTVSRAGESRDAGVRAMDADNDLALLQAPLAAGTAATFSRSPRARLGEAVTVAGYPLQGLLSNRLNVTSGNVSALAGVGDDVKRLQITAPVQPGNSGGPLLDAAGNVIGVVVSRLVAVPGAELSDIPQNVNFAIKGALVRGFLDIHGVAYRRRASDAELAPELIAEQAQGFTVAVHCWQ